MSNKFRNDQRQIEELKRFCASERKRIYSRHRHGIGGKEIVEEQSLLADNIIHRIYKSAIDEGNLDREASMAILALGGYARKELNPHSDIDLMLVHEKSSPIAELEEFANKIVTTLWDLGFEVGNSFRSIEECIKIGKTDLLSKTSMIDARHIVGSKSTYRRFKFHMSKRLYRRKIGEFVEQKIQEWKDRHEAYGSTIYLQEPNIKESVGGLRDFHTAIWLARIFYRITEPSDLRQRSIVPPTVYDASMEAIDFLFRLRNELHYVNKRSNDKLSFELHETVAKNLGYSDSGQTLAEEVLMRGYYLHAEHIYEFAKILIDRVRYDSSRFPKWLKFSFKRNLEHGFALCKNMITFQKNRDKFSNDATRIMKVFALSQQIAKPIGPRVRRKIAENLHLIDDLFCENSEVTKSFLSILAHDENVAYTLRCMHRWRVLDRYIAEFSTIRSLVKSDRYHLYTVDEHTFFAVENLEFETLRQLKDGQVFINIMAELENIELLRLAALLHDIGKGIAGFGNHDQRGLLVAEVILDRMAITGEARDLVLFLMATHSDMSHTAQQRDLDDPKVIARFAELVQNEKRLKYLYLLTFADIRAVSASIWNDWNALLLWKLYSRTLKHLSGEITTLDIEQLRSAVAELISHEVEQSSIDRHFANMRENELALHKPEFIAKQIELVEELGDEPIAISRFDETETHTQMGICTRDARGIFRKITSVFAVHNVSILSAEIDTRSDGIAIDLLTVAEMPTQAMKQLQSLRALSIERCEQVEETLKLLWQNEITVDELATRLRTVTYKNSDLADRRGKLKVDFFNDESEDATIIEIRVFDRVGLLFSIADLFYELGLDISLAKVTTQASIAVDSFYVTEKNGLKVTDSERIEAIKNKLKETLLQQTE